jgi:hypothetical protein
MHYQFLVDTYETERLKTLGVWSMFHDEDLSSRPHPTTHEVAAPMSRWCINASARTSGS